MRISDLYAKLKRLGKQEGCLNCVFSPSCQWYKLSGKRKSLLWLGYEKGPSDSCINYVMKSG